MSAFRLVPLAAARVAAVCRRSWKRNPVIPTTAVAGSGEQLASERLDHAYAVTVDRMQGTTVDRAHAFADGGGRELAYVAMSRARDTSHVYVVADDLDQAAEDLTLEWSADRRQRGVLDVDEPAIDDRALRPSFARQTESATRRPAPR